MLQPPKRKPIKLDTYMDRSDPPKPTVPAVSIIQPTIPPAEPPPVRRAALAAQVLSVDCLHPFEGHPFRIYEGERLDDMVESIRQNGVLTPIIVRTRNDGYEILSGHNRVAASKLAGVTEIPAIVKENLSDDEAWIYVIETNLMQRSFADMLPSEKAAVLYRQHSKMFSQGKRNDILQELENLEKQQNGGNVETCAPLAHKLKTREVLAENYGMRRDSVARLLRIHQLAEQLKARVDSGELPLRSAVYLSYLTIPEQDSLEALLAEHRFNVSIRIAEQLRDTSRQHKLDDGTMWSILTGKGGGEKKKASPSFTIKPKLLTKYFPVNTAKKHIEETIDKALEEYFEKHRPADAGS